MINAENEKEKEMVIDSMSRYRIASELYDWMQPVYCLVATNRQLSVDNVYNLAEDVLKSGDVSEIVPIDVNDDEWYEDGRRELNMTDIARAITYIKDYDKYQYMYLVDGSGTILAHVDMDAIRKDCRHKDNNKPGEPKRVDIDLTPHDDDFIPF